MIIRRKHSRDFATISNRLFDDERLQADEVGVLGYLLSRPHDWEVRRPQLARRFKYGREAIKRVMWNAMRSGWIIAQKTQLQDGRFFTIYEVRDTPGPELSDEEIRRALSLASSEAQESDAEDSDARENSDTGDPPTPNPATGQPGVVQPATGNPYVASKEEATKYGFTKDVSTKERGHVFADVQREWPIEHVLSSVTAEAAYVALTDTDADDCYRGLKPYLSDCKAQNRKVCDLTTFIRERRWERFVRADAQQTEAWVAKPNSAQWFRWREYRLAIGERITLMEEWARQGRGWPTKTEWPPAIPVKQSGNAA